MMFEINLMEFRIADSGWWWLGFVGIEVHNFDGHLLYVERDVGYWKFDLLWLRPLWLRFWVYRD